MSTSSSDDPPPGRQSLDAPPQGPIPQFDFHLKVLTDSYLSFFQERRKVEETYIDSLNKLQHKVKAIDGYLDDRLERSTTRNAWNEVRENVERECQARQAFLNTLVSHVIEPLLILRETQDRTRKRVKEDIKGSAVAHMDYAENQLPKLKRAYLKKCQEVEDHKATPASSQALGLSSDTTSMPNSKSNPNLPARPVVTSPQPLRPLDRRPSGSAPAARARSPTSSTSTALSDLAHQGKRQLNQLVAFLDKSGNVKESLGGRGADNTLRSVRAKREADEADKEYRKGVYWLETLRLRRVKILEAGYNSLERFLLEGTDTIKKALVTYTDTLIATCTTQTHLASHARSMVDKINPEADTSIFTAHIPRSLAASTPKPVFYYNYRVGECKDLIFGVSIVDYATARGLGDSDIPKIIRICIDEVDRRGLLSEGIYRVSGRHAIVQELQHKMERNEQEFAFNPVTDDVYSVSSLLKLYLRELPEPLFKFPLSERIQHSEDIAEHASNDFVLLRSKIRRLHPIHRTALRAVVDHLARVASHTDKNKMDPKNLAIVFGGVIFGEDDIPQGTDLLNVQSWKDSLMEDLIENALVLFDDRPPPSPPLPAAPAGESAPVYTYGSSHTRVASVPSLAPPPPPASAPGPESDFSPKLPPRPTVSIHPSARAGGAGPGTMSPPPRLPELFADEPSPSAASASVQSTAPRLSEPPTPTSAHSAAASTGTGAPAEWTPSAPESAHGHS